MNYNWNGLPVVIFGNSGAAAEVKFLLNDINSQNNKIFDFICFIDNKKSENSIHENDFFEFSKKFPVLGVILPFGTPNIKEKIYTNILNKCDNLAFPNIIHPNAIIARNISLGYGNIICANVVIDPDAVIKNFIFINAASVVGHDTIIEDYVTVNISSVISGNCHIKKNALVGTNCSIKQGITIGENSICGMSAIIVEDIPDDKVMISKKATELLG